MRKNLNDIVVEELQAEHDDIMEYRKAVASGIEGYVDPVLDDTELTDALQKVISHYNTKINGYPSYDNSFTIGGMDGVLDAAIGNINYDEALHYGYPADHITVSGSDNE